MAVQRSISPFQIPTSMSESLLRVIALPSVVYSYLKLDIEQNEIHIALLIKQETEWIEWFCFFLLLFLVHWNNSDRGHLLETKRGASNTILTAWRGRSLDKRHLFGSGHLLGHLRYSKEVGTSKLILEHLMHTQPPNILWELCLKKINNFHDVIFVLGWRRRSCSQKKQAGGWCGNWYERRSTERPGKWQRSVSLFSPNY